MRRNYALLSCFSYRLCCLPTFQYQAVKHIRIFMLDVKLSKAIEFEGIENKKIATTVFVYNTYKAVISNLPIYLTLYSKQVCIYKRRAPFWYIELKIFIYKIVIKSCHCHLTAIGTHFVSTRSLPVTYLHTNIITYSMTLISVSSVFCNTELL